MSLLIPATVVPFTYAVTFPACTPIEFATRSEFVQWAAERRSDLTAPGARKGWAADLASLAEAEGYADGVTAYGDAYGVEAWQSTAYVGPSDDARAYLASRYPAGTPVTAGDAMHRDVTYVGRITRHVAAADVLVVEWVDGSTTEGAILDMARMLDTTDAATLARAERARDEAEAERITEAARAAYLDRHPEHSANFGTDADAPVGLLTVWTLDDSDPRAEEEEHRYPSTTAEEQRRIVVQLIREGVHVRAFRGL